MKISFEKALLKENILDYQEKINAVHESLVNRTCKGNDYLGWYEWPYNYDKEEFDRRELY